jgi:hypothetical protein
MQLIYASQAVKPMSAKELLEILQASRENNQRQHITGKLVYKDSIFLQVLEGEESDLETVWANIKEDPRHHNIVEISYKPIEERDFTEWAMGFVNMSGVDLASMPGYTRFLENDFSPDTLCAKPCRALSFLLDLKYCELP